MGSLALDKKMTGQNISDETPKQPLLVFINPRSGTGIADKLYRKYLLPNLSEQGVPHEVITTDHAGHASEVVSSETFDPDRYRGIVTISGDGLMFEVLNGIYKRWPLDWADRLSGIPIGLVPGGLGNALNCSVLHQLKQPLDGVNNLGAKHSANNVALGAKNSNTTGLDFIEVETHDGHKLLSFLGVTIGLVADVDLGSEFARFLGYIRAYFLVAYRILFPRAYLCKVSYLPLPLDGSGKPVPADWVTQTGRFFVVYAIDIPLLDPLTLLSPDSKTNDGVIWLVMVRDSMPRKEMVQWLMNAFEAGHVGKTGVELVPVRAFRIDPIRPRGYLSIDAESFKFGCVQGQMLPSKARLLTSS